MDFVQKNMSLKQRLREPDILCLYPKKWTGIILLLISMLCVGLDIILHYPILNDFSGLMSFGILMFFIGIFEIFNHKPQYIISPHGMYRAKLYRYQKSLYVEWDSIQRIRSSKNQHQYLINFTLKFDLISETKHKSLHTARSDQNFDIANLKYPPRLLKSLITTLAKAPFGQRRDIINSFQ